MALTPLDLQTLFVKMNEVNREQAHLKGAEAQEQAFEAKRLVEQEIQKDSSVNKSPEESDMDNRIKDKEEQHREEEERKGKKKPHDEEEQEKKEYIKDPDLGQHIDLMG
ncbi:MAG: hypothetical protein PQJ60_05125 [Spirochaetales bacterium]|nr:hypothetical protein [Spirochaetales bacterium]